MNTVNNNSALYINPLTTVPPKTAHKGPWSLLSLWCHHFEWQLADVFNSQSMHLAHVQQKVPKLKVPFKID